MRETRSYGSVRGVLGNRPPYRDPTKDVAGEAPPTTRLGSFPPASVEPLTAGHHQRPEGVANWPCVPKARPAVEAT
jgi:hypothetical protein